MSCYIDEYDEEETVEVEVHIDSIYTFGHLVYKDGATYKLKGLGGSGVHSFTKVCGSGMIYLYEEDVAKYSLAVNYEANLSDIASITRTHPEHFEVALERTDAPLLILCIKNSFRDELFALLNENRDLVLKDRQIDLFLNESITDKIPNNWRVS